MKKTMHISLRAGEKLYVNGAVLRVDRKVSMEFLNDVTFLLENHVIHPDEATTPLRQLYFMAQTILIEPARASATRAMFDKSHALLCASFENRQVLAGLATVQELMDRERVFDALKIIRTLFPIEQEILSRPKVADSNVNSKQPEIELCK